MKTAVAAAIASFLLVSGGHSQDRSENPPPYQTVPGFGIPNGFYTDYELRPHMYLEVCKVSDTKKKLTHEEKLAAALLVIAADHANFEKYHQSYGVSMGNPLPALLKRNFPGLSEVKASHDVNPGELPIRDLGKFFRAWLEEALSEELQAKRVKKAFGIEDEPEPAKDDAITKITDLRPEHDGREVTMILKITAVKVSKGAEKGEVPQVMLQVAGTEKSPKMSVSAVGELHESLHRMGLSLPEGKLVGSSIKASGVITVFDTFAPPSDEEPQYYLELQDWRKFQVLPDPD